MQLRVVLRRVDRALGIDADDLHLGLALVEPAADAGDRAAGADGDDDRVELAAGLLPDLRRRDVVVRLRVRHVRVLVGLEPARDLLGEARRDGVVALRRVVVDRGRRDHDLGAVRAQHRDLLLAHLVRHDEDEAVALVRGRDREPDAGVAGGRLDDRPARLELPVALGRLDHREPDAVLHRAAGVEVLELREDPARRRAATCGRAGRSACRRRGRGSSGSRGPCGGKPTPRVLVGGRHEDRSDRQGKRRRRARAAWQQAGHDVWTLGRDGRRRVRRGRRRRGGAVGLDRRRAGQGDRRRGEDHDRRDERVRRPQRGVRVARARGEVDRRRPDGEVVHDELRRDLRRDPVRNGCGRATSRGGGRSRGARPSS